MLPRSTQHACSAHSRGEVLSLSKTARWFLRKNHCHHIWCRAFSRFNPAEVEPPAIFPTTRREDSGLWSNHIFRPARSSDREIRSSHHPVSFFRQEQQLLCSVVVAQHLSVLVGFVFFTIPLLLLFHYFFAERDNSLSLCVFTSAAGEMPLPIFRTGVTRCAAKLGHSSTVCCAESVSVPHCLYFSDSCAPILKKVEGKIRQFPTPTNSVRPRHGDITDRHHGFLEARSFQLYVLRRFVRNFRP